MTLKLTRPMLASAATNEYLNTMSYPRYGTPKIDGIRSIIPETTGSAVSRTFKPLRNKQLNTIIDTLQLPVGLDWETTAADGTFQDCASAVMNSSKSVKYRLYIFDYVKTSITTGYLDRMKDMKELEPVLQQRVIANELSNVVELVFLYPKELKDKEALDTFEAECLGQGFEGVMIRTGKSPYKCGRSTVKEGYLLKVKRFSDSEILVESLEPWTTNNNPQERDAFGLAERSSSKANLVERDWLGTIVGKDITSGHTIRLGSGLNMDQRKHYWEHPEELIGQYVTYKYFAVGVKDLPRHPIFKGVRPAEDVDVSTSSETSPEAG